MTKKALKKLAEEQSKICVTISLNTHRTHPDNLQDEIVLKNLITEAKNRISEEFKDTNELKIVLEKLDAISEKIDVNYLLDSLHIFVSEKTEEIVQSIWKVQENKVYVDEQFAIKPLVKIFNRSQEYLLLQLAMNETKLFKIFDESVEEEIRNHVFPFGETPHLPNGNIQKSDSEYVGNLLKEHFRDIDKALVDYILTNDKSLKVVVATTEENYHALLEASTRPETYIGSFEVNHNKQENSPWFLAKQAWEVAKENQQKLVEEDIEDAKASVSQGKLSTDLFEIYKASVEGNAEFLLVNKDFTQPAKIVKENTIELINDANEHGAIDDIVSIIAWEVISKGGKAIFVSKEQLGDLGDIALKKRY
ncbi:MAG: hypothetical protein Q4A00_07175 [Flavobacteriaceae bacterium]|nr:hypothetical protein [Flavobacteriaceae bacterium]